MSRIKRDISPTERKMGESLRALRQAKMTQVELASALQPVLGEAVRQSSVSDWETGRLRLHGELIAELCRILETDANTLLGIQHPKHSKKLGPMLDALAGLPKREQDRLAKAFMALIENAAE